MYGALFAGTFAATLYFASDVLRSSRVAMAVVGNAEETAVLPEPSYGAPPNPGAAISNLELVRFAAAQSATREQDGVLSEAEYDDRAWAIAVLADAPSAASVEALAHVLATSGDRRERLDALAALQHIGAQPQLWDQVRDAIQKATADPDREVAARARAALNGG